MPFMHDCLAPLVDSTTGLYTSTGTHSTGLSHQHTIRESSRTQLHSGQQHEYTLSRLPEIYRKPLKYGHLYIPNIQSVSPMVCVFRRVPLYNIHLVCAKTVITLAYSKLDQLADEQLYDACTYSVCTIVHLNCCWLLHSLLCWIWGLTVSPFFVVSFNSHSLQRSQGLQHWERELPGSPEKRVQGSV